MAILVLLLVLGCIYALYPPSQKLKLGLDIRGGLHMNLAVDRDKMQGKSEQEISEAADRALEILRNRVDGLGVSEPVLEGKARTGLSFNYQV